MSGLPKQPLRIPMTGGLAGKDAPLVVAPGSHLQLDNVRQERTGEWRRRHGRAQTVLDTLPVIGGQAPVRAVELPGGGVLAFTEMSSDVNTCARLYSPTAAMRWTIPPQFMPLFGGASSAGSGQASIPVWSRSSLGYVDSPRPFTTFAEGNGLQFTASTDSSAPTFATAMFKTLGEGEAQGLPFTFGSTGVTTTAIRPRAVYFAGTPGTFMLLWIEGGNLVGQTWTGNGVAAAGPTVLKAGLAAGSGLDAMIYPSQTTVTVAYQDIGNLLHVLEVNPNLSIASDVTTTVAVTQCVQLLPNPDGTPGPRFAAVASANLQQVVRFNSTGGLLAGSPTVIGTLAVTVTGFAGVAVNGGGGAVLVLQTSLGGIWASKMTTSVTPGAITQIVPNGTGIYIDSNGWREPGTDALHWIAGLHIGLPGTTLSITTDFQHTFYEMALEYGGVNTVANQFSEPQARMIPLQAGPPAGCDRTGTIFPGAQCQVVRTGASAFSLLLPRLARVDTGEVANPLQYAMDRWDVLHLNGSNMQGANLSQGVKGYTASYVPSGQLLQTVDGQQIVAHGASAIPSKPVLTATTGGGLTPNNSYGYVVVVEMTDEAGNVWRSTPSIPVLVPLTGGQNAVSFTITLTPLESSMRKRTVKLYRTFANGSVYFLTFKKSDTPAATTIITGTDFNADALLGTQLGLALEGQAGGEQPATVTPAFSHIVFFDGRLWGIDRDFPTRVWYSKPILQGTSPEFPASFNFDMPDELGPLTALAACDDKLVLFKSPRGVYYVPQGGPNNDGSGNQYMPVRLSSENGLLTGQPYVSTGADVFFTARNDGGGVGIYRINKSLEIDFAGLPVDQYLGQSAVQAPDVLVGATYSDTQNEIRFLGQAAQYVFDLIHGIWMRDTLPFGAQPLVIRTVAGQDMIFLGDGTVWTEGNETNLTDPGGAPYSGVIRSAWLRPAELGGYLRLYSVRLLLDVVGEASGPQQTLFVYFNNSETTVATPLSPVSVQRGEYEARTRGQKCGTFSLAMLLASGDVGVRLDGWTAFVGIKYGGRKMTGSQRWQ